MKTSIWKFQINIGCFFLSQIAIVCINIANTALLARFIGADGVGYWSIILIIVGFYTLFMSFGINLANTYFVGSDGIELSIITSNSITLFLIISFIGVCVLLLAYATDAIFIAFPGISGRTVIYIIALWPICQFNQYMLSVLQGLQRIVTISLLNFSSAIVFFGFIIYIFIFTTFRLTGVMASYFMIQIVLSIVLIAILKKRGCSFIPRWDSEVAKKLIRFGLRGHVGNIFQFLNYRMDWFFIHLFLGPISLGYYAVSSKMVKTLWYLPNAIGYVLFPKTASEKSRNNTFLLRTLCFTIFFSVFGSLLFVLFGKQLILIIFSSDFSPSFMPMLFLLPGAIMLSGAKILANNIAGSGYPEYNSYVAAIALIATVLLDIYLIPKIGLIGAAIASSISYSISFFLSLWVFLIRSGAKMTPSNSVN